MQIDARLKHHPDLDAGSIEVTVDQSQAVLSGTVPDDGARRLAEAVASGVDGIESIRNELVAAHG